MEILMLATAPKGFWCTCYEHDLERGRLSWKLSTMLFKITENNFAGSISLQNDNVYDGRCIWWGRIDEWCLAASFRWSSHMGLGGHMHHLPNHCRNWGSRMVFSFITVYCSMRSDILIIIGWGGLAECFFTAPSREHKSYESSPASFFLSEWTTYTTMNQISDSISTESLLWVVSSLLWLL